MNKNVRKELLFYYESRANPNGDPGFENQPRLMPDDTIMVTDVRIKRTIRDYAANYLGQTVFVTVGDENHPVTSDDRAKEIVGSLDGDVIKELIKRTFDVPLFGALVTVRKKSGDSEGNSFKLTGPVQFAIAKSVNKVSLNNVKITSRFVGKVKEGKTPLHGTIGEFTVVDYALIKAQASVNPMNLGVYVDDDEMLKRFFAMEELIAPCLWHGTNSLVSRSKYPQRSILLLEVTYDNALYNDIDVLVDEAPEMKGYAMKLCSEPFNFTGLINALEKRRQQVLAVKLAVCNDIKGEAEKLLNALNSRGIKAEYYPFSE
ncbi:MAG: type I CRISPR-associated protein Cas7 [Candidatus Bathyarchaeota archaeon]|nr:type I CRISPR-associated protein Cas7 [Candidatus Bathyarchaeota archaeon]